MDRWRCIFYDAQMPEGVEAKANKLFVSNWIITAAKIEFNDNDLESEYKNYQ
jgi:hypothetical protein